MMPSLAKYSKNTQVRTSPFANQTIFLFGMKDNTFEIRIFCNNVPSAAVFEMSLLSAAIGDGTLAMW